MASFTCQSPDALMGRTLTLLRRPLGLVLGIGGLRVRRARWRDRLRGVAIASKIEPPRRHARRERDAIMSTAAFEPAYVRLLRSGELADRARRSRRQMENCDLCARYCRVNRLRSIAARSAAPVNERSSIGRTTPWRRGLSARLAVTPSHVVAQILASVTIAAERGLRLPLVYNTGGYDSLDFCSAGRSIDPPEKPPSS